MHNSFLLLDKAIIPPLPKIADDFKQFQDLFKRVPQDLEIPFDEVSKTHLKLLRILHTTASSKIALLVDEVLIDPANTI